MISHTGEGCCLPWLPSAILSDWHTQPSLRFIIVFPFSAPVLSTQPWAWIEEDFIWERQTEDVNTHYSSSLLFQMVTWRTRDCQRLVGDHTVHRGAPDSWQILSLTPRDFREQRVTIHSIEGKLQACLQPRRFVKVKCFHFDRRTRAFPKYFSFDLLRYYSSLSCPHPQSNYFTWENPAIVHHAFLGSHLKGALR